MTLNLAGGMAAGTTIDQPLFTIPEGYRPFGSVIINYITQKGTPMVFAIVGDRDKVSLNNLGVTINNDWLCRLCVTYIVQ